MTKVYNTAHQTLKAHTVKVGEILSDPRLSIPHYQRPYKWRQHHVAQLLEDIQQFSGCTTYRLGSLVLHEEDDKLEIVDGQQRTITLSLIIRAFVKQIPEPEKSKLRQQIHYLNGKLFNPVLEHKLSRKNALENYRFIEQRIKYFSKENIFFLIEKCEFVQFTLTNLSIAFQFFDSQNARGKDLEPHDLLKAYHLRAFNDRSEEEKEQVIQKWEKTDAKKLAGLFQYYLFRIKKWSNHRPARKFTKSDVGLFKGIDLKKTNNQWPFTQMLRIVDDRITQQNEDFPFQLEMPIMNGRLFFEMVTHYLYQVDNMWKKVKTEIEPGSHAATVISTLVTYRDRNRRGDQYIKQLFDATLLQYIDKFGFDDIDTVICHLFVWAYQLRLKNKRVQLATMDSYAFHGDSYLFIIKNALQPKEVTVTPYPTHIDLNYKTGTSELQKVMRKILGEKIFSNG